MSHLHITNGDVAADLMREGGIGGEILPWRDVLHDGPVPARLDLEAMSRVRARYIADCGWASFEAALVDFRERDAMLAGFRNFKRVTLWFEHDLYDQLQLLQLLDWFATQPPGATELSLICSDEYLGRLPASSMAALFLTKEPITDAQLRLAQKAWRAFCAPEPESWQALLDENTSALPFLADTVLRHLEQFPSVQNGLNRTETQLLEAVSSDLHHPGLIFDAVQRMEERVFMGDTSFFLCMKALFESTPPLIETRSKTPFILPGPHTQQAGRQEILLTDAGERILRNELDWVAISRFDKWLGGVHLTAARVWRWDRDVLALQSGPDQVARA